SVNAPITSTSGELDVNLKAGNSVTVNTSITTNGGGVFISKWDVPNNTSTSAPTTSNESATETPVPENESSTVEPTTIATTARVTPVQAPTANHTVSVSATETVPTQAAVSVPQTTSVAATEQSLATDTVMESAPQTPSQPTSATVARSSSNSMDITINQPARLETDGGNIILNSGDQGNTIVNGTVNSRSSLDQGGDVVVAGNTVTLSSTARVDASGDTGGGNIVIGRDASTPTGTISDTVDIAQGAQITSNAGSSGDGGNVFIQAQTSTNTHANISSQGSASGTSGTVSISSQQDLNLGGNINVRASNTSNHNGGSLYIAADSLNIRQQRALNAMNQLGMDQLEQFGDIDLNIRTQNDLTFENINNTNSLGQSGDSNGQRTAAFTSTDGNITFTNTSDTLATTGGRLVLDAENGSLDLGNIENNSSQPSSVELYANNSLSANNVSIASGNFVADSLTAGITLGNVSIDDGDITLISESSINTQDLSTQSGDLNIDSIAGSVNLQNVTLAQGNADLIANNTITTRDISLDNGELNATAFSGDIELANVNTSGQTNLQANNSITASGNIIVTDGDITVSSSNGNITTNSVTANLGSIDLLANQSIQSNGDISAGNGVVVSSTSGSINTQAVHTDSGDINLTAENGIVVNGGISATTGAVVVDSRAGGINASTVNARDDVLLQADQQITVQGTTSSQQGDITITSKTNNLELGNVTADSGDVLIQARGDIKTGDLTTTAGELDVKTTGGSLALGEIQANQLTALSAIGDIQANSITVESGDTSIISQNGGITIGSVDQSGALTAGNIITRNGNILLQAEQDIVANDVTSSSELEVRSNSGSMTLGDVNTGGATVLVADNDIETNSISVQSGNLDVLSDNGSIVVSNVETLNGNVKLNANESINANDINAEGEVNIATVKDSSGSITVNNVNAKGLTEILADQDVTVNGNVSVDGGDLAISAFRGTTQLMQDITATDEVRLFASGDLTTEGISGAQINAGSKFGAVDLGSIDTDGDVQIKASQSITIGTTNANILLAETSGSTFTSNGVITANEVSIDADSIFFQGANSLNAADVIATNLTLDIDKDGKVEGNIAGNPGGGMILQTRNRDNLSADSPVLTRFRAQFNDSANSGQNFSELDTFVSGQDSANLSGADFNVALRDGSLSDYDTYIYVPPSDPVSPPPSDPNNNSVPVPITITANRGDGPSVAVSLDGPLTDVETPGPSNSSQTQRSGITTRNVASQSPDGISTERHNRANRQSGPEPELPTISSAPEIDGTILEAPVAPVIEETTEQEPVIPINTMPTANNAIDTAPAVLDPNMDSLDQANQQASDIVVPITAENDESGCGNSNHLAWLQSGIRSAAETADMGRGDGTSGEDVFKNCY
ncbi:MAG: beta strand repeat-containing protein, partial [Arenicella sp.]